jgi:hypothetical protein
MALQVDDGAVRWMERDGTETAAASGIRFGLTPVDVPGRQMYHYALAVHSLRSPGGARSYDMEREWLCSDTIEYLELHQGDDTKAGAGSVQGEAGK